jgi:hypothetical protein
MKDPGVRSSLLLEFLLLPAASETLLTELVELLSQPSSSDHPVVEDHCRSFMKKLVRRAPTEDMIVCLFESLRVNMNSWLSLDAIYVIVAMGQCSSKVKGMLKGESKVLELIETVPNHSTKHSQK